MLLSMKSSRRKQSKPIRVSCIEGEGVEPAATTQPSQLTEELPPAITEEDSTSSRDGEEEEPMEALSTELQVDPPDVIATPPPSQDDTTKKPADFPTEYHRLGNQLQKITTGPFLSNGHGNTTEESVSQLDSTSDLENSHSDFPTAYHRLGNELQKDQPYLVNGHSISGLDSTCSKDTDAEKKDTSTQDSDSKESNGDVSFKSDGTRIFHPDAYCELCDREFCNKYFLKTHKANKHGVYDHASSPFSMSNFPSFAPAQEPLPQNIQAMKTELALVPVSTGLETMRFTPIKTEIAPPQQSQIKALPEKTHSETAVNPDMEDYCEICQKHFCNKYYLKKHKQDVHGITPDTSSSRRRPQLETPPSSSTVTSAPLILPQNISSMANVMVLNPFAPSVIIQAQPFMAQHHIAPAPQPVSVAPVISQPLPHPDQSPSISIASIASTLPNDALRGMGVLNAEAFCELCRKEFCNKYFLKIHKANKHGIFTDDLTRGLFSPGMFPMSSTPEDFANLTKLSEIMKAVEKERANSGLANLKALQMGNNDSNVTYCNICNMEFSSKYSYKIHKMNVHGILSESAGSPEMGEIVRPEITIKTEPETELSRPPSQQSLSDRPGNSSNQESGVSTMFGSMIAAKLADRVQCDICNKELCNKYFLKAHKLKLHGIDTSPLEKDSKLDIPKLESKLREERGAKVIRDLVKEIEAQGAANKTAERPPERELVKLGIDPEAYCEICKKEFCSKYFLRTHKLKLHGIKTPKFDRMGGPLGSSRSPRHPPLLSDPRIPLSLSALSADTPIRVTSSEALVAAAMSAATAASIAANTVSVATASSNSSPTTVSEMNESFEKHTWRWKEPVNSSRVACELCNKELCNKYFLRTHKLNKHGISLEEQAKTSPITSNASSVEMPDSDTASSTSSTGDQGKLVKDGKRSHTIQKLSESLKLKQEDDQAIISSKLYDRQMEVCNLCDKRFKNMHRLQVHLLRDHSLLSPSKSHIQTPGKRSLDWLNSQKSTCHLCSAEFSDLLTLQLHLIQEHNAQVSLKPEPQIKSEMRRMNPSSRVTLAMKTKYSRGTKPKVYSCLHCDYKTRWLSNIYSHEERKHKISKASGQSNYPCTICLKTFLYEHSYLRHLRDHHQQTDLQIKPLPIQVGPSAVSKQDGFRCRKCGDKFSSRFRCLKHVREVHIRSAKAELETVKKFSPTVRRYSCKKCSFTTRIPDNLRRHRASKHLRPKHPIGNGAKKSWHCPAADSVVRETTVGNAALHVVLPDKVESDEAYMTQSFKLQDGQLDSNFMPAVIRMAVRSRVSSPVTVTFTLTPTEP